MKINSSPQVQRGVDSLHFPLKRRKTKSLTLYSVTVGKLKSLSGQLFSTTLQGGYDISECSGNGMDSSSRNTHHRRISSRDLDYLKVLHLYLQGHKVKYSNGEMTRNAIWEHVSSTRQVLGKLFGYSYTRVWIN